MERYVVTEDGEIIDQIHQGDKIVRAKSRQAYKDLEAAPEGETFTKLYHKVVPILNECGLSASEFMIFVHLACNLRYKSNVAKYGNGRIINRQNIQSDLQMTERTVKRSMYSLINKHGLVVEAMTMEGKAFIVNPFVVSVGDRINRTIYDLFRKSKWARW